MIPGLINALKEINQIGINNTWHRIQDLASYLREGLSNIEQVQTHDIGKNQCGIVSFSIQNLSPTTLKKQLDLVNINSSVSPRFCTALDMNKRGLAEVNRASVHYYNTKKEIDFLLQKITSFRPN